MNNYNTFFNAYQVILPLSTEVLIPHDDSVRLLSSVLGRIDFSEQNKAYTKRRRDIPFIIMLRVVVYGFMRGIRSTREIERACRENINFMWLLEDYRVPDHNMVARFVADVDMESVLVKVNKLLAEMGELKFQHGFIDGTKLEANANRYTFVWKKSVEKYRARLLSKIDLFLRESIARYAVQFCGLSGVVNYLEHLEFEQKFGKGKRKPQQQRDLETAKEYLAKLNKYEAYIKEIGSNRKSMSKTDPDATFMRLKDDHMKNGQLKPAYNVQLCIESEYITGLYVSPDRNDTNTLKPFLDKMESGYGKRHKTLTLDSGYESEENYAYLDEKKQTAYIKPQNYEQSKTRKLKRQIGRKENMIYDEKTDSYTCANGKRLNAIYNTNRKSDSGYGQTITVYRCADCTGCAVRPQCTKAADGKNKELSCSRLFENYRAKSLALITSGLGVQLRVNRSIQSEGTFGIVKQDYGYRRFNRRGQDNVTSELALVCIAFNLNKLHSNILADRLGFSLHELSS